MDHESDLVIDLGPGLSSALEGESSTACASLAGYVNDALRGLGLPLRVRLHSRSDPEVALRLNGHTCPLMSRHLYAMADAHSLTKRVADSVVIQLPSLLDEEMLDRMLRESSVSEEARPQMVRTLRQVLSRGISCTRAINRLAAIKVAPDDSDTERLLNIALSSTKDLRVGIYVSPWTDRLLNNERFSEMVEMMQDGFFYEFGVVLPKIELVKERTLPNNQIRMQINDVLFAPVVVLGEEELLVNAPPEVVKHKTGVPARPMANPANLSPCCVVAFQHSDACDKAGFISWDLGGYCLLALHAELRRHPAWLSTPATVNLEMALLEEAFPSLYDVVFHRFTSGQLAEVFSGLLSEHVGIRDHRGIVEAMLAISDGKAVESAHGDLTALPAGTCPVPSTRPGPALTLEDYVGAARRHLSNLLSHQIEIDGTAPVLELDPAIAS